METESEGCFCKRLFVLLLAPGSALEKFAAIVCPPREQTYYSELDPLIVQCLGNLWKSYSLTRVYIISDLILLRKADKHWD